MGFAEIEKLAIKNLTMVAYNSNISCSGKSVFSCSRFVAYKVNNYNFKMMQKYMSAEIVETQIMKEIMDWYLKHYIWKNHSSFTTII